MSSINGDEAAVFDLAVDVQRERLRLRLLDYSGEAIVERRLIQPDDVSVTVIQQVRSSAVLKRLIEADAHHGRLRHHVDTLVKRYELMTARGAIGASSSGSRTLETGQLDGINARHREARGEDRSPTVLELLSSIDSIALARNEAELFGALRALFERHAIPVDRFIFAGLRLAGDSKVPAAYRIFGECDPEWLQLYVHRRWYMIDPFFSWMLAATGPVPGSQLVLKTPGQRDFVTRFRQHGFRHYIVTPARTAHGKILGVLITGNDAADEGSEHALLKYRQVFRSVAAELLEWAANDLGRRTALLLGLSDREVQVLNLLARGHAAPMIAKELGVSVNRVYKAIYPELTIKMGVDHITKALAKAIELGLAFPA